VNLSLRVKDGQTRSVLFQQGVANFRSFNPDFPAMRKLVRETLKENKAKSSASASPSPSPSAKKKKKASASPTPTATPQSSTLDDTCAFDPEKARTATRPS
jgi:polyisoprenyl-teichoic acid--peptidoglycan teichoic acid transferase